MNQLKDQVTFIKDNESRYISKINESIGSLQNNPDFSLNEESKHFNFIKL